MKLLPSHLLLARPGLHRSLLAKREIDGWWQKLRVIIQSISRKSQPAKAGRRRVIVQVFRGPWSSAAATCGACEQLVEQLVERGGGEREEVPVQKVREARL